MKKYLFFFALIVWVVTAVGGCRLTGPTDTEVFEAMQAVMRGFQASMDQEKLEINDTYANAADGVFRNDDESVVTNIAFITNEDSVQVYGNSIFSEYEDNASDYFFSGEFSYNMKAIRAYRRSTWYGDMDCNVELTGGKIKTLEFTFSVGEDGVIEEYLITANDVEIDLTKEDSILDILERFGRGMPG